MNYNSGSCNKRKVKSDFFMSDFVDNLMKVGFEEVMQDKMFHQQVRINIITLENGTRYEMALPGFSKEEVQLKTEGQTLHITTNKRGLENKEVYKRKNFDYGSFKHSFKVASTLDLSSIKAKVQYGVLSITFDNKARSTVNVDIH